MYKQNHDGFTLIELLMVVAVIGIISAIALPLLLRSKISGNEASAIGSMRATVSAQHDYHAFHAGYAIDLATLAAGCPVSPSAFISADMDGNGIVKNGYIYALASGAGAVDGPADCRGVTTKTSYYGTAKPSTVSFTGNRAFAVNVVSTIWQDLTGNPPTEPFTMSPTVSPLGRP
jgi:prepilin-type N-terminal cleavage/methylation domain-containing protein